MADGRPAWRREPERGSVLALGALSWLARHAPDWVTDPLIWLIALWFTNFPTRASRCGSDIYLRAVLGRVPRFADRFRQNRTFAHVMLDRARLLSSGLSRFSVGVKCEDAILRHHRAGRGGVLLGAHFGSFEALRALDRQLPGLSVRYLMFQEHAAKSTRLLDALNPAVAAQVIPIHDGQGAMLAVRDALEAGHFVAFLGDRMPVRNQRGEIEVQFLGGPVDLPRAPYLCAILTKVPLILCFAPRTGARRYEIAFAEVYDGAPVHRGDRDALCHALAQKYADALSAMCRKHPYNWFNFFDIWGADPEALRSRAADGRG
jgi:predicted LPLAT superfamily acyltransferase